MAVNGRVWGVIIMVLGDDSNDSKEDMSDIDHLMVIIETPPQSAEPASQVGLWRVMKYVLLPVPSHTLIHNLHECACGTLLILILKSDFARKSRLSANKIDMFGCP